jgi:hypothetical protein
MAFAMLIGVPKYIVRKGNCFTEGATGPINLTALQLCQGGHHRYGVSSLELRHASVLRGIGLLAACGLRIHNNDINST